MPAAVVTTETRERLGKLLLMLSSAHDGERAAAAAAIERALKSAGLSWHDLAGLVTAAPATAASSSSPLPSHPTVPLATRFARTSAASSKCSSPARSRRWSGGM